MTSSRPRLARERKSPATGERLVDFPACLVVTPPVVVLGRVRTPKRVTNPGYQFPRLLSVAWWRRDRPRFVCHIGANVLLGRTRLVLSRAGRRPHRRSVGASFCVPHASAPSPNTASALASRQIRRPTLVRVIARPPSWGGGAPPHEGSRQPRGLPRGLRHNPRG